MSFCSTVMESSRQVLVFHVVNQFFFRHSCKIKKLTIFSGHVCGIEDPWVANAVLDTLNKRLSLPCTAVGAINKITRILKVSSAYEFRIVEEKINVRIYRRYMQRLN
jgi:hypothetical protein